MVRAQAPLQLPVRMTRLLDEIDVLETTGDPSGADVSAVEHDSRRVGPGALFCCIPGTTVDGHDYAADAVRRGAVGVVCERPVDLGCTEVVRVRVAPGRARASMARLAAAYWGHPAESLLTIGVTGTNGKTTVTHLLGAILSGAGRPTTVIGTLTGRRTTPESTELQRRLAAVRDTWPADPTPAVAMEVSSHALVQSRVDGIRFDVAVFTNLSHEHLDFHGTLEAYFEAKASLFTPERAAAAVVNGDDAWGRVIAERARIPTVVVHARDVSDVRLEPDRSHFAWRGHEASVALTGLLNVGNAHLAAEAALVAGIPADAIVEGLAAAPPVPGRLELVGLAGGGAGDGGGARARARDGTGGEGGEGVAGCFAVLVDYAHTPAALEAVLHEARRLAAPRGGRTIVVFGCGGERDRAKRPLMGAVAARLADSVFITSDNPRREDPSVIAAEIAAGSGPSGSVVVEIDRRAAIERALGSAQAGDVVLVAGKGHEPYQEVGECRLPFDDRAVVREVLASLQASGPPGA